jgi:hypothetical protein
MTKRTVTWHCPPKTVLVVVDRGDVSARVQAICERRAADFGARLHAMRNGSSRRRTPPLSRVPPRSGATVAPAVAVTHVGCLRTMQKENTS